MANDYKYRADVIGKLVPPEVIEGEPSAEQLDNWAKRALQMQTVAAFTVATDGEYKRHNHAAQIAANGAAGGGNPILAKLEAEFAVAVLGKRASVKVSLPSPSDIVRQLAEKAAKTGAAFDEAATAQAAVAGVRAEIKALIEAGVLYVQLNSGGYDRLLGASAPDHADELVKAAVALDRAALEGHDKPASVRFGFRFGRTGQLPVWSLNGADQARIESLFALPADRLLIDFGLQPTDFSVLQAVPANTHVVLGLLDNTAKLKQAPDMVLGQIDAAAKFRSGDLLSLSPRGGFNAANGVTWAQQKDVLEQVAEVVTRFWGFAF